MLKELSLVIGFTLSANIHSQNGFLLITTYLIVGIAGLYPHSGSILFCCLGQCIKLMLKYLKRRIESEMVSSPIMADWKYNYALISRLVDRLNECFGFVLLVTISSLFIRIINNTFLSLLDYGMKGVSISALLFVVKDLVYLVLLTVTSDHMRKAVQHSNL